MQITTFTLPLNLLLSECHIVIIKINKMLQTASGQTGPGTSWSLFEDQVCYYYYYYYFLVFVCCLMVEAYVSIDKYLIILSAVIYIGPCCSRP